MPGFKFASARLYEASRRRLLKVIGLGLVTGLVSPIPLRAFATETQDSIVELKKFMSVSMALTKKGSKRVELG
jgi:hypothetical protein